MEDVLEVYHRPHDTARPLVCLDETSLCRARHREVYADSRTMPNRRFFPRIRGNSHVIDSA
jgi:hypothetical protein